MQDRTFNVHCDFYPQTFLITLATDRNTISTNAIYRQVRSQIIASGDMPPPASQLHLSIVKKIPFNNEHTTHYITIKDADIIEHGLASLFESNGIVDDSGTLLRGSLLVHKDPGKLFIRSYEIGRHKANVVSKIVSDRNLCKTFTRINRPTPRGSSSRCLRIFGSCMPGRSLTKTTSGERSCSPYGAQPEMLHLLPSETQ